MVPTAPMIDNCKSVDENIKRASRESSLAVVSYMICNVMHDSKYNIKKEVVANVLDLSKLPGE